jgi:hypothetical protein
MLQVYADYSPCIPPREITLDEIRFFYEPLIESLCLMQRAEKKNA